MAGKNFFLAILILLFLSCAPKVQQIKLQWNVDSRTNYQVDKKRRMRNGFWRSFYQGLEDYLEV